MEVQKDEKGIKRKVGLEREKTLEKLERKKYSGRDNNIKLKYDGL